VTSNRTALIELIPDSLSIHTIKAKSPPGASLRDHFIARHGQVYRASLTCPTGIVQSSYHQQLEDNLSVWTAMYLSVSALSSCLYFTVYMFVSALSTCLYLHCLSVWICTVYLSASALSSFLNLHCLPVCICIVYRSVSALSTTLYASLQRAQSHRQCQVCLQLPTQLCAARLNNLSHKTTFFCKVVFIDSNASNDVTMASLHRSHDGQCANLLTGNARVLRGSKKLCREHGRVQPGLLLPANQGQA